VVYIFFTTPPLFLLTLFVRYLPRRFFFLAHFNLQSSLIITLRHFHFSFFIFCCTPLAVPIGKQFVFLLPTFLRDVGYGSLSFGDAQQC